MSNKIEPGVQRFRATILRRGVNFFVEVPQRVSLALAGQARAGRVYVEGRLNAVEIRATLVPVGAGKHRLYVNGGMRSAAGVGTGDTIGLELRATSPEEIRLPNDVLASLRGSKDARAAFDSLSPSHRRELLRYIDDARTPEGRHKRIEKSIQHALGAPAMTADKEKLACRPLWTCPRCGNDFVNRNQTHSCMRHTLEDSFAGKPERIRELFDRFRAMVEACGPAKVVPYRNKVGFMVRVRFAGAVPKKEWLEVGFWLTRRIQSRRFRKIETIYPNAHIHTLRITAPEDLDGEVAGWVKEAYSIGCQEHLRRASNRGPFPRK